LKAEDLTFQKEMGPMGKQVLQFRGNVPGVRYFVPFVTTLANILTTGLRKSPLGSTALLYRVARQGLVHYEFDKSGWTYKKTDFIGHGAEQLLAWGILFSIIPLVSADDDDLPILTGTVPYNRGRGTARDMAFRTAPPMSIKIGGKYYSYARIEPQATMIATTVDGINRFMEYQNGKDGSDVLGETIGMISAQLEEKTFAQGFSDIIRGVENPSEMVKWFGNFVPSWMPNIIRNPARALDDNMRDTKIWGQGGDWWAHLSEASMYKALPVPWFATPPKVDVWGREVQKDQVSAASDFLWRTLVPVQAQSTDKITDPDRAIMRWNEQNPNSQYFPKLPAPYWSKKQDDGRTRVTYMTRDEYESFLKISGARALESAKSLSLSVENPTEEDIKSITETLMEARKETRRILWEQRQTKELASS
jgi:hypothetical protein